MQTILGAGGAIGSLLAGILPQYTQDIRLVGKNPKAVNPNDELLQADLTKINDAYKSIEGADVVYMTVGLPYKTKLWEATWPVLMDNIIGACKYYNAKLVFFDNMYMYDPQYLSHMTEETPVKPTSRKGKVRAKIAGQLMHEAEKGNLDALIARSADFVGPVNSILTELVFKNLKQGKKAQWLVDADKIHSFTSTKDAAEGTAMLGNTPEAFNQVWHLPTDATKLTVRQWVDRIAAELNVKQQLQVLPRWSFGLLGLFIPIMKELKEMAYQYDRDYFFDSSKFTRQFNYTPMNPEENIRYIKQNLA